LANDVDGLVVSLGVHCQPLQGVYAAEADVELVVARFPVIMAG
jgi:hypothetical protein